MEIASFVWSGKVKEIMYVLSMTEKVLALYIFDSTVKSRGHCVGVCLHAKSLQSCLTLCDSLDCSHQPPLSMDSSRQVY